MEELGKRITDLRKKEGLTQSELARKIDISHTQITRYELKIYTKMNRVYLFHTINDFYGIICKYKQ